jgi:hypothetical protein
MNGTIEIPTGQFSEDSRHVLYRQQMWLVSDAMKPLIMVIETIFALMILYGGTAGIMAG